MIFFLNGPIPLKAVEETPITLNYTVVNVFLLEE